MNLQRHSTHGCDDDVEAASENKRKKYAHGSRSLEVSSGKMHMISAQELKSFQQFESGAKRLQQTVFNQHAEIRKRGEQLKSYRIVNDDKAVENQKLQREITELKQKLAAFEQQSAWSFSWPRLPSSTQDLENNHEAIIENLEDQCHQLRTQMDRKDEKFKAATADLLVQLKKAEDSDPSKSRKVSDDEVENAWGQLVFNVRQFVDNYMDTSTVLSTAQKQHWSSFISNPGAFFTSPKIYPVVFEARIWDCLTRYIFSVSSYVWGGELGQIFYSLVENAKGIRKSFHPHVPEAVLTLTQQPSVRTINLSRLSISGGLALSIFFSIGTYARNARLGAKRRCTKLLVSFLSSRLMLPT